MLGGKDGGWESRDGRDLAVEQKKVESDVLYPMDYYGKEGLGRVKAEDITKPQTLHVAT